MNKLLILIPLVAIVSLIVLQTNRFIYIRSLGLFLILGCAILWYTGTSYIPYGKLLLLTGLMLLGFLSDFYSASLRTWYFRVSQQAIWGVVIGGFIGLLMWPFFNTITGFLVGSLLGALIGEIKGRGFRSIKQITKASVGACAGLYGMSLKLLLGLEMVYWLLRDMGPGPVI